MSKENVRDYNHPDPPLPEHGVGHGTKVILELYAHEIMEHASSISAIHGLSGAATQRYKNLCFKAAQELNEAATILKQNLNVVHIPHEREGFFSRLFNNVLLPVIVGAIACITATAFAK